MHERKSQLMIIRNKKDLMIRFPIGLVLIILIGLSPFIVGGIGSWFWELRTGQPCHEGNCFWMALIWYFFITIPLAGLLLILYLIIVAKDTIRILKK